MKTKTWQLRGGVGILAYKDWALNTWILKNYPIQNAFQLQDGSYSQEKWWLQDNTRTNFNNTLKTQLSFWVASWSWKLSVKSKTFDFWQKVKKITSCDISFGYFQKWDYNLLSLSGSDITNITNLEKYFTPKLYHCVFSYNNKKYLTNQRYNYKT
jgi:hypothetical protein